jgi:hypothetical protein
MDAPRSLLRHHGVTLLLTLGIVYVFVTGTLPALADRAEIRQRRADVEADIERLETAVEGLQQWNEAAALDPVTQERLRERWRLAPEVPGYRHLPDPQPGPDPVPESPAAPVSSPPGEPGAATRAPASPGR